MPSSQSLIAIKVGLTSPDSVRNAKLPPIFSTVNKTLRHSFFSYLVNGRHEELPLTFFNDGFRGDISVEMTWIIEGNRTLSQRSDEVEVNGMRYLLEPVKSVVAGPLQDSTVVTTFTTILDVNEGNTSIDVGWVEQRLQELGRDDDFQKEFLHMVILNREPTGIFPRKFTASREPWNGKIAHSAGERTRYSSARTRSIHHNRYWTL